jgi:F-type H+-transporting ATPase subunit a
MGEHGTWFDYLNRFEWWQKLDHSMHEKLGRGWKGLMFQESGWSLTHVLITILVVLLVFLGARSFFKGTKTADKGLVPPRTMNLRNMFEYLAEALYGYVEGGMGDKLAKRFYPFIGALFIFILFNNMFALLPGFSAPTDTLKTNVGIALLVFLVTHIYGVKEHGLAYFKHFLGPTPALAPLMLPIELVSHLARPVSLSLRLMGNMMADHKVVMAFFALIPVLVPLPFMLLGLLVCLIQAVVFTTLAMVYIGMAMEHEEH